MTARWMPLAVAFVLLLGANALFNRAFFDGRQLAIVGERSAPLAMVALGMTLVIAVRGVDLSVGAVMAIAGSLAAFLAAETSGGKVAGLGWPVAAASAAALAAASAAGLWNGALVSRFGVPPIVATLVLMVAGRGAAQLIGGGQKIQADAFGFLGAGHLAGLPVAVWAAVATGAAAALLTRRTALGLFIESVGDNPEAARLSGVPARPVLLGAYGFCGFSAGAAGLLVMADTTEADPANAGLYWELDAILATVLGGTPLTGGRFSLAGSVVGALFIQVLNATIRMMGVPADGTLIVKAAVVLAVCLIQSAASRRAS